MTTGMVGTRAFAETEVSRFRAPMEQVPELFFDARSSSFSSDGSQQIFDGDVIALGAGNVISADKIAFSQKTGTIEAEGHIIVISNHQVFTGDKMRFFVTTGDFRLDGAVMTANDPDQANSISRSILGFSRKEMDFEFARRNRLDDIKSQRSKLRESSRMAAAAGVSLSQDLVDRYVILLEQEDLLKAQENPALARLGNDRRSIYQRRRQYWERNREDLYRKFGGVGRSAAFFTISGGVIERVSDNDFRIQDALFTSCKCDPGEAPVWAIRAQETTAQIGGYADFQNAVIEISGVPVFYLPFFRVPIKDSRQSGFLLPVISHDPESGSVYSQPVYFDFGESADATVTADFFQRRGTRLGLEFRKQTSASEGWNLNLEGMRDRIWISNLRRRDLLTGIFSEGLRQARRKSQQAALDALVQSVEPIGDQNALVARFSEPDYWNAVNPDCLSPESEKQAACDADLARQLRAPDNLWRGSAAWSGVYGIGPRLTLVSRGIVQTDHRYASDLYVPDDFQAAILHGRPYPAFHRAGVALHHGGSNYYLGVGSHFADNIRSATQFDGEQLPLEMVVQSRLFQLNSDRSSRLPVYGSFRLRHLEISDRGAIENFALGRQDSLGSGRWQNLNFRLIAPLISKSAVKVDHFLDADARMVSARAYEDKLSQAASMRMGVRFQLPLDGLADVSRYTGPADGELIDSKQMLQHLMNWSLVFTTRPSVWRSGPYAVQSVPGSAAIPTYFQSDRTDPRIDTTDVDLPEEDQLRPYQTVSLVTSHRWRLFTRGWRLVGADTLDTALSGDSPSDAGKPVLRSQESLQDQARRELLFALDRPLRGHDEMFGADGNGRFYNRYESRDIGHRDLLTLQSGISYDFRKARQRTSDESLRRETRPWSEPYLDLSTQLGGWGISSYGLYNIYDRVATKTKFNLIPPSFWSTSLSFAYSLDQEVDIDADGEAAYRLTTTRSANVATTVVPRINLFGALARRTKDQAAIVEAYETRVGASYESVSGCWGLRFLRTKEFDVPEENAVYLLQLAVTFMGQTRSLPDMSGAVLSRLPSS